MINDSLGCHFYVQDVRYAASAGMHRSGDVQDVRYAANAGMHRRGDVQDVYESAGAVVYIDE